MVIFMKDRNPSQTLKQTGDNVSFLLSIGSEDKQGISTADMMKAFARGQYHIATNAPKADNAVELNMPEADVAPESEEAKAAETAPRAFDSDPNFLRLAITLVQFRHAEIAVKDYPSRIQSTVNEFQNEVAQLKDLPSKSAKQEGQNQESIFVTYKADALQCDQRRHEFANTVDEFVKDGQHKMGDVVALIDVKSSEADIRAAFADIRKKLEDITKQTVQLNRNEEAVQKNLDNVLQKITQVLNAERTKLGIPVTEEMQRRLR